MGTRTRRHLIAEKVTGNLRGMAPRALFWLFAVSLIAVAGQLAAATKAASYHLVKKVTLGGDGGWDYLSVDPQNRRVYMSRGTHVMVYDIDKGAIAGDIPNTPGVHGIALAPKLGRGFTSNGGDGTVTIFDLKTLKPVGSAKAGTGPDAILYDPATKRVFAFNGRSHDATAIDASTGQVVGTIPLDGKPEFGVTDEKGEIFVNLEDKSEIVALDANKLTVLHRWSIAPGDGPSGLAIDRAHRRLFAVCGNEKMVVVDADSGKVVATPTIGRGPDAAAFDPSTGMAFSSNGQDGTLTVIHEDSPNSFTVMDPVPTQRGARTMALDTKTHEVFLVTADVAPPAPGAPAGGRRRSFVPGSFTLLIVGQ